MRRWPALTPHIYVLGSGPAARIAQLLLHRCGLRVSRLGGSCMGLLTPLHVGNTVFTPVPLFPVVGTALSHALGFTHLKPDRLLSYRYADEATAHTVSPAFTTPCSLGAYLQQLTNRSDIALTLAAKQLGCRIFCEELPEVRRKVDRNYVCHSPRRNRLPFVNGFSPYYTCLADTQWLPSWNTRLIRIDIESNSIVTDAGVLHYDYLVSTIALPLFLEYASIEHSLEFSAEGIRLELFMADDALDTFQVTYDCDPNSPVFRCFVPQHGVLVAQVARTQLGIEPPQIASRLQQLLVLAATPRHCGTLEYKNCYPLGVSDIDSQGSLERQLADNGIGLFGRFATWQYVDLHELPLGDLYARCIDC